MKPIEESLRELSAKWRSDTPEFRDKNPEDGARWDCADELDAAIPAIEEMVRELKELAEKYEKWRDSVEDCAGYEGSNAGDIASASDYLTYKGIAVELRAILAKVGVTP